VSSYFDDAARKHREITTVEDRLRFAGKVAKRVEDYLLFIEAHSPKTYAMAVHDLRQKFERAKVRADWDEDGAMLIENMHSLAHDIGSARVPRLYSPRQRYLDNPYFTGHFGAEEVGP
jgi:hypothetical protein